MTVRELVWCVGFAVVCGLVVTVVVGAAILVSGVWWSALIVGGVLDVGAVAALWKANR